MPDNVNFFRLLVGFDDNEKIAKTKKGTKAFVRTKVTRASSISTTAATSGSPPPAKKDTNSATSPKTEKPDPTTAEWTDGQDAILSDMKQRNRPWKEIEATLPGKDRDALKQRYREICAAKGEEKIDDDKGEKKAGEAKVEEAEGGRKKSSTIEQEKEKEDDGKLKKVGDSPIIYLEPEDQLDPGDLAELYKLHAKAERTKWIEISSRFFDKTGKRVSPDILKGKLKNC